MEGASVSHGAVLYCDWLSSVPTGVKILAPNIIRLCDYDKRDFDAGSTHGPASISTQQVCMVCDGTHLRSDDRKLEPRTLGGDDR